MIEFENRLLETTINFLENLYYLSCKEKLDNLYE